MQDMLKGIKVVEVASWMLAPSACAILAEWGADVIKIEEPVRGDPQRALATSPIVPGGNAGYMVEVPNRGKRSVGIDISEPDGLDLLYRLVEGADVFVTNHLPAVCDRLKIGVEAIRARNPAIIYARCSAYGPEGPDANTGGFDSTAYWARGGLAAALTLPGDVWPPSPRPGIGDMMGGMALAGGISTALVRRERTGKPSVVDISLLALALWQLSPDVAAAKRNEGAPPPEFDRDALANPLSGTFRTRDDRFLTLMMLQSDRHWTEFCGKIGRPELAEDARFHDSAARFENRRECTRLLRDRFFERTLDEWREAFSDFSGIWAPLCSPLDQHSDPQVQANRYIRPIEAMDGTEFAIPTNPIRFDLTPPTGAGAPVHGQHTEEVLLDLGLTFDEILDRKARGVVL